MRNKETEIQVFLFETAWGWCGTKIGPLGVLGFQLPIRDCDRALDLASQRLSTSADDASIAKFTRRSAAGVIARKIGRPFVEDLVEQVRGYFDGRRREAFDLPLDWAGATAFQKTVWKGLLKIPLGRTVSYGELARRIGRPKAARAVGGALGANPIPLIVPCHRVLAAGGRLGGFSAEGGAGTKKKLLDFELTF